MSMSIASLVVDMALHGGASFLGGIAKMGAAVGAIGVAAGGMGLAVAAGNEQAEISFTTMLGSAEKAGSFLTDLKDFAAKTPFEFPELQTAASSLVSAGFAAGDVIPIMTTLGNVTSGMGTGAEGVKRATIALQQMSAAGKITGEDLNQLRDAGIPVFDLLAGATGKSKEQIAQLAAAGKLGKTEMDAMFDALKNGGPGLERFGGLMEKQSHSFTGMISTLKDTVMQGLGTAMQPALEAIKGSLGGVTDTISTVMQGLAAPLAQMFAGLTPAIGPIVSVLGALLGAILPIVGILGEVLGGILGEVADLFSEMRPEISELAAVFGGLLRAVAPLIPAVLALLTPIIPLANMLGRVLVTALNALVPPLVQLAGTLLSALRPAIDSLAPIFEQIGNSLGQLLVALVPLLPPLAELLLAFLPLLPAVLQLLPPILDLVTLLVSVLVPALTVVVGIIEGVVAPVIRFFARLLSEPGKAASDMADSITGFFSDLPGRILGALGDIGSLLYEAGMDMIRGFINGIKNMAGAVVGAARSVVSGAVGAVKGFLGIGSPSRVFMEIGGHTIDGLLLGLRAGEGKVSNQMGTLAGLMTAEGSGSASFGGSAAGGGTFLAGAGGGGITVNVTVNVPNGFVGSAEQVARAITPAIRDEMLRTGDRAATGIFAGRG